MSHKEINARPKHPFTQETDSVQGHMPLREWKKAREWSQDMIEIHDLQTTCIAKDSWGAFKAQTMSVTFKGYLSQAFHSSAQSDTLDNSTVNYGTLYKSFLRVMENWNKKDLDIDLLMAALRDCDPVKADVWSGYSIDLFWPNATRFGEGYSMKWYYSKKPEVSQCWVVYLRRLTVATVIGVNDYEKKSQQNVVVSVWIDRLGGLTPCELLEETTVNAIRDTSFETLEALAEHVAITVTVRHLCNYDADTAEFFYYAAGIRVRLEKPAALLQAGCPIIDIYRRINSNNIYGRRLQEKYFEDDKSKLEIKVEKKTPKQEWREPTEKSAWETSSWR